MAGLPDLRGSLRFLPGCCVFPDPPGRLPSRSSARQPISSRARTPAAIRVNHRSSPSPMRIRNHSQPERGRPDDDAAQK